MTVFDKVTDHINADAFVHTFISRKTSRRITNFFEQLGPDELRDMVADNRSIATAFTDEQLEQLRAIGREYSWVSKVLTNADIAGAVPHWAIKIIAANGENGRLWLRQQVEIFKSYLVEGGDGSTGLQG